MKRYRMVECLWLDAVEGQPSDWTEHGKVSNDPMPSRTVGYLIAKNRRALTIAALVNENHVAMCVTIPRRMVTSLHYLCREDR